MKFVVLFSAYFCNPSNNNDVIDTIQYLRYYAFIWCILCPDWKMNSQDIRENAQPDAHVL